MVLSIENPPVNALSLPVRQALLAAVEQADAAAEVAAIVIHGAGTPRVPGRSDYETTAEGLNVSSPLKTELSR
jgi:hypothetical protein